MEKSVHDQPKRTHKHEEEEFCISLAGESSPVNYAKELVPLIEGKKVNPNHVGSLALAYMGDAVYELFVRHHLLYSGQIKPNKLHHIATKYVSAKAQRDTVQFFLEQAILSSEEEIILKRGRNAKSGSIPKNTDIQTYNWATGFETLIGHLYLSENFTRLRELVTLAIEERQRLNDHV